MKKLLAVTVFLAGFAIATNAQQSTTSPRENRKEMKMKMKDELNLSPDQQTKMEASDKEFKEKAKAIRENKSLSMDDKKAQMKSLHKERMSAVDALLTPEQLEKRKQLMKDAHHRDHKKQTTTK